MPVLRFGPFELDRAAMQLRRDGRALPLRPRPLALLCAFAENSGRVLEKDQLLEQAWPGVVVEENNLQVQVSVLRKLLGARAIATVPGVGYRFELQVHEASFDPTRVEAATADELVGRDEELAQLLDLLSANRCVTLTGPGGIGKTRLARVAMQAIRPGLGNPGAWIDLATVHDGSLIASLALEAMGGAAAPGRAHERLRELLGNRQVVMVLDNAEHVLEDAAQFAAAAMDNVAGLRLLVTSQGPLRIKGEQVMKLGPLRLPPEHVPAEVAASTGAVALFARRARQADSRFELDDSGLQHVMEICRRLDGIPLAIELAAARWPAFGLAGLARVLDERFRVLTRGERTAPPRQQTLAAVYDWSYGLLRASEQALFRRLACAVAPLPLAQVVALLGADADIYEPLATLVDHSLVQMDDGDAPRYSLYESAREYALEKLLQCAEYGDLSRGIDWHEQEGDRAAQAASGTPALAAYGAALELVRVLPATAQRDARELDLSLKLGPAIQATLGPAHPRCEAVYRRSVELARATGPGDHAFKAVWGYWQFLSLAGRDEEAAPFAREIVDMAQHLPDDGLQLEALHAAMTTSDLLGDARAVVENARRIMGLYDRCRHHRLTFEFGGHDPGVCALGQCALNLWLLGQTAEARRAADEALALAAQLEHGYSRATAAYYAALTYAALGDTPALEATAGALVGLSAQYGMEMLLNEGRFLQGRARFERGDALGIPQMETALRAIEHSQDLGFIFVYMALLAQAQLSVGRFDAVDAIAGRAADYAIRGQRLFLPEVMRVRGLALAQRGDSQGRSVLQQARSLARSQGAAALEGRFPPDMD